MKSLVFLLLIFISFYSWGQTYGNEWINYNQRYYSLNITQSGIHRIDYSTLTNSGIPVDQFTSANVQIFGREKEIPILIEDGGDNQLNAGDFILFYAQRNDSWLDSTLFEDPTWIGNPKYSMYNDTIQYFFTWNTSSNNSRILKETDINFSTYAPSPYVLFEKTAWFNEKYNEGEKTSDASSSFFVHGEGWGKTPVNGVNGYTWDFSSLTFDNVYQAAGAPWVKYRAVTVGNSNAFYNNNLGNHHTRHTIGQSNYELEDSIFVGYKSVNTNTSFPVSILPASGNSNFKVSIIGDLVGVATDFQSINYYSFTYPRIPSFSNSNKINFVVENNVSQNKVRLNISNVNATNPVMLTLGSISRWIPLVNNGGQYQALIPNENSGNAQEVIFQDMSTVTVVNSLKIINESGYFTAFPTSINPEKALIFAYPTKLKTKVLEYAAYRNSISGGNYNVVLANVDELYQQFGGGIPKHINGIRRFSHMVYDMATEKPKGLFLIGKGIREANITSATNIGPGSRTNAAAYQNNLVPSFGQPSCDQCITSNLPGTNKYKPLIPTGRISVLTNDELGIYLSKVIEYENQQQQNSIYTTDTKDWQKQILHFSGGSTSSEQQLFQNYLNNMGNIAESEYFAGNATLISKDSDDPITPSELEAVKQRISDGVTLMNFFGHFTTSESGFDVNIDEPQNWDNQGKYPILLANSCYNGNIFHNSSSNSQTFTLTPNAGVIAYIGTINYGFTSSLNAYSTEFYKQFSKYNYGGTIAEHIQHAIDSILPNSSSLLTEATFCQMTLNGDPMLKVNYHNKPEIELTESRVSFGPSTITLATDSIQINITLRNLGQSILDTFNLQITRDFPGSLTDSTYLFPVDGLNYEKQLAFKVAFQPNIGVGLNKFEIRADIPSIVTEQYDEITNNQILKTLFVDIDGIEPIFPTHFAVVPNNKVKLSASTINPLAPINSYRFEVDTVYDFSSLFRKHAIVSGLGGLKQVNYNEWFNSLQQPDSLILTDSTVYYWRVGLVEPQIQWKNRSFQYIPNKEGWGQADFRQFTENNLLGLSFNLSNELRQFQPIESQITCLTKSTTQSPGHFYNAWSLNGVQQDYDICNMTPKFHVAVIDKTTLLPWETRYTYQNGTVANPNNNFGNQNDNGGCAGRPMKYFTFHQNSSVQIDSMQSLVNNQLENGDYVLIYTPMTTRYDWWNLYGPELYQFFQNLGSDSLYPGVIRPNRPFIFLARKGDPNFVVELFSQNNEDIFLDTILTGLDQIGAETSPVIGPVAEWKSFFWNYYSLEPNTGDSTRLKFDIYNSFGAYQYSIDTLLSSGDSVINLSNQIDASVYPYMKLNAIYRDNQNQTPSQLQNWHILYAPLPEAAIDGNDGYIGLNEMDTLQQGQSGFFAVNVKNIGSVDMDSLLVNYYILDNNQQKQFIDYPRQDSLRLTDILNDTIYFETKNLIGLNYFCMEVNPYVNFSQTILDQPELTHINNILQIPFVVVGEDVNPILDVTFDGRRIMNEDIVSPNSEILITLKDENPYLIMNEDSDTSRFGIYLKYPDGSQYRIPFMDANGNSIMQWTPANENNKKFKIIYPTALNQDGIYELIVQGTDKSGNLSGDLEYRIKFKVVMESSISNLLNYPNPFSTSTRFVFTLTGSEVPDDFKIQIMTVTGKVVKEIDESELGSISIGTNISQYAWDGRDEFGDLLANGIYLYRVDAKINGKDIKLLSTDADQYFHRGIGKMYLIR
jgi:hypothetical protein